MVSGPCSAFPNALLVTLPSKKFLFYMAIYGVIYANS